METAGILRVEAGGHGHAGHPSGFQSPADSKRKKIHDLVELINKPDLKAAVPVFAALSHLEPTLQQDSQWRALGHALEHGEVYVAQHFVNALQARAFHAVTATPAGPAHYLDPEHGLCINVQA